MSRTKRIYIISMLLLAASITSYLFYIDDEGYPRSDDSLALIIGLFIFYTAIVSIILIGCTYWLASHVFKKSW